MYVAGLAGGMIDPRASALVSLLALIPVGLYAVGEIGNVVTAATATVSVLIVTGSLLLIFREIGEDSPRDRAGGEPRT